MNGIEAIAIGASAGGVEALLRLLPELPQQTPQAVIIVQHIPRDRPSRLVEVFAARCTLPVDEAQDKEPIRGGRIYFAPPDYHLLVDRPRKGTGEPVFALSVDEPEHFSRPSIDVLFESAALVYGARLLGIVLTGANADGARGLLRIKAHGGATMVQSPDSAVAAAMPSAALALGGAEHVLDLEPMAAALRSIATKGDA